MSGSKAIQHRGFVCDISEKGVLVRFTSQSACSDCHAKGVCSASGMKEKEILIKRKSDIFTVGEEVDIEIPVRQGSRAVMFGYVYPLLVFLISILALTAAGTGELRAGLFSILILAPYYFSIYFFKDKIDKGFNFSIRKAG